ncbi:MAG: ATP-binding protein [Bryobacteraceae bacterium]
MTPSSPPYRDYREHLADELRRLDRLLHRSIRSQSAQAISEDQAARAIYISPVEVEWLLETDEKQSADSANVTEQAELERLRAEIDERIASSRAEGVFLPLAQLCDLFELSGFERDAILICLAPELRRKYDRLYAFVQDDITRKRPSVDLVLQLLCNNEAHRWNARCIFSEGATLLRAGLLEKVSDPHSPSGSSGLAEFLKLDPRMCEFLLGGDHIDARLAGQVRVWRPGASERYVPVDCEIVAGLRRLIARQLAPDNPQRRKLVLHLHGPQGAGKRELALYLCREFGCPLLQTDAELLLASGSQAESLLRLIFREALFLQAAVFIERAEALLQEPARRLLNALEVAMAEYGHLVFLSAARPWADRPQLPGCAFYSAEVALPDVPIRAEVWKRALQEKTPEAATWAMPLASQFRLTPGQIEAAVESAQTVKLMDPDSAPMLFTDLTAACRRQPNLRLGDLAIKIEPRASWDELILPQDKIVHLREICSHFRHRYRVLCEWGYGKRLSYGKGLSAIFSGPSGTGKTMAAEVLARELDVDLYKVDLSGVVSKYLGETEKNLRRIFEEAEASNAILFFDEADALFGKRTKVADAHDRYANVETSYLLQKMEEYEGVVILATNLSENMDDAFTRRIRFIVEFPFPDEANRLRIWKTHLAGGAREGELDLGALAREFNLSGGHIRNIALAAAFSAASEGSTIRLHHILHGTRREFEKLGRKWRDNNSRLAAAGD